MFYTIQGEGYHGGTASVFIRLSDCNLACSFCDTEFKYGEPRPEHWILSEVARIGKECRFIVLTGGEPSMQNIKPLVKLLRVNGYYVMIETNGMFELPKELDWVCVSPKINTQSKKLVVRTADEYKFVVPFNGRVPNIKNLTAPHYWISPMNGTAIGGEIKVGEKSCTTIQSASVQYAVNVIKDNPKFKLNVQMHKYIGVE